LDNNGYVIISKNQQQTGKFFGEIDGTIMDSLVQAEVYQRIRIYDYQAVCMDPTSYKSSAAFLLTVCCKKNSIISQTFKFSWLTAMAVLQVGCPMGYWAGIMAAVANPACSHNRS